MRYVRVLVWICLVLFFPVHLAGCADFSLIGDGLEEVRRDVPRSEVSLVDLPLSSDAGLDTSFSYDLPFSQDSLSSPALDAREADAAEEVGVDTPMVNAYPAMVLSPTTCHGRTLHLPDMFFQTGLVAWHFCYVTPDPHDREDGGAAPMRPASVSFQVGRGDSVSTLLPMVTASAPLTANPWMASVAVALPTNFNLPRFNVRQDPPIGLLGVLWALDGDGRGGLRERGTLRVWRVAADGQQMEVLLAELFLVCGGSRALSDMPTGNYVPQGMCPTVLMSCMPGPYHCQ
jgi:hypothetical protein